jgi:hypothetical protein
LQKVLAYFHGYCTVKRQVLLAVLATSAVFVGSAYAANIGPFEPNPPEPTAEVESLTITDRGCRGEIRPFSRSRNGPNGTYVYEGVINAASPNSQLAASVGRTSPENARVLTYRVELQTLEAPNQNTSCEGELAYQLEITAPSGTDGERVATYLNGRLSGCGGGSYGPDVGCGQLYELAEKTPVTTNQSTQTSSE